MTDVARSLGGKVVCTGESKVSDLGKPDYAVHVNRLLAGYVELKAPGVGADFKHFTGHNREQWNRFKHIPNLIYCDGNEWGFYRDGKLVDKIIRFSGDIVSHGKKALDPGSSHGVQRLLQDFLSWEPIIPRDSKGKVDLKGFAELLAPLCRLLRDDVTNALRDPDSPLVQLANDWRQLLFPDASDDLFADAYAQTVAFALLLGRSEGADPLTLESGRLALAVQHSLLSRALQVLTDASARAQLSASVDLLLRVIGAVPPATLTGPEDPWLYFYEDFLAAYDPELRKKAGAYYTPVEVVRAQVRLIDDLLVNRLGKSHGFLDPDVLTLDPAAGTGTYLLGVIEHAVGRVKADEGAGAVPGRVSTLARNLYGFEIMVGPFAVSELRVSRALRDSGAFIPEDGSQIYLTDTLESPHAKPAQLPLFLKPIADQHRRALKVKSDVPVIVCVGNPPYGRHEAAGRDNKARTGGWVRWGDDEKGRDAILRDFLDPALASGHGVRVHNLYNNYVYFWRWALWKVFEHETSRGAGVVSFISASSYLDGAAFCGMREHMRRVCDEIWIIDLGGEGRGARTSDNVFAIQTPVAIAIAVRACKVQKDRPAKVQYARLEGDRACKLAALDAVGDFAALGWQDCPDAWQAPFRPSGKADYFRWPLLADLMPWQQSGVKAGRTWVISPDQECLRKRWKTLLSADKEERRLLFKESPTGRKMHQAATRLPPAEEKLKPVAQLDRDAEFPVAVQYAYRSFDRQFIFADARLLDRPAPSLWRTEGCRQVYLTSLFSHPLGAGPAVTAAAFIPDLHHFRGSFGAKDAVPLYLDADATEANILAGLLELLSATYRRKVTSEAFVAYVYGLLAQPAFTARFARELETCEVRVPITKSRALFTKVGETGARLLWLHTYGQRFVPEGGRPGHVPRGAAKCVKAVPGTPDGYPESFEYIEAPRTLHVGEGQFRPVAREVFEFEVSGLKVVQSWLNYRMKKGAGRKSSPLDDIRPECWTSRFTTELLELLWVLQATVEGYPAQAKLLDRVIDSRCFQADELPAISHEVVETPAAGQLQRNLFGYL